MRDRPIKGTTEWTKYEVTLSYDGESVREIVVGGLIVGNGKMWMDDLSITIDGVDIAEAPIHHAELSGAMKDTSFSNGSGIARIALNPEKVEMLAYLGKIWGFMKYHHYGVKKGEYNMDAQLFRLLPEVIAAKNKPTVFEVIEKWIDNFSPAPECKKCDEGDTDETTKLKADYGDLFAKSVLPTSMAEKLSSIRDNRVGVPKEYYHKSATGVGNPIFSNEIGYTENKYPDAGTRLLSLFRYWNMIQYYFPDRHLIGEDWNKVLPEFIPEFVNAKDTLGYQLACLKLIARINDSHAGLWAGANQLETVKGDFLVPFQAKFIENKLLVTGYFWDTLGVRNLVQPGDVIEKINGIDVGQLVKKYLPLTPGSNYVTRLRNLSNNGGWLLRSANDKIKLVCVRDGVKKEITVSCVSTELKPTCTDYLGYQRDGYKKLNEDVGYIFPAKLKSTDLEEIETVFKDTKGIIIDMRCYPSVFMPFTYGGWLLPEPSKFVEFTFGYDNYPGRFELRGGPAIGGTSKTPYKGKIVIIVNEMTQSQAEYTTMALSAAPGAVVIGSQTAGADGNVSSIELPGGLSTMISGIGVLYPDGTETQRTGVKIDKVVKPTIKGIRDGRDEVMEAAMKILQQ